jgi:diamine N-acetyltransferase
MKHPDYIDGQRVRLRPATLDDRCMIYRGLARSDVTDILLGHPSQDRTPLLSYEAFCDDYKQHFFNDSWPEGGRCFVIEVDGKAIGQVNYNDIETERNRTELDIWMFAEEHCGHGYGTEALRLLCEYLRCVFQVGGFVIKPSAANPRAIGAYEKAGFSKTSLPEKEAVREYGKKDGIDTVYMTRNIEQPHRETTQESALRSASKSGDIIPISSHSMR